MLDHVFAPPDQKHAVHSEYNVFPEHIQFRTLENTAEKTPENTWNSIETCRCVSTSIKHTVPWPVDYGQGMR